MNRESVGFSFQTFASKSVIQGTKSATTFVAAVSTISSIAQHAMATLRTRSYGLLLILVTLSSGCADDPSGVGLGLIDAQAGEPFVLTVNAEKFEARNEADITGGFIGFDARRDTLRIGATRVLSGLADDPELGTIDVKGYADFTAFEVAGDDFRNGSVSSVSLILDINYIYGDTLSPVVLQLSEIQEDWPAINRRADTTLAVGAEITRFTVNPQDNLATVELPTSWIQTNEAMLRSETLADDFHGFRLSHIAGNAVLGFSARSSALRIAVPGDTLTLTMDRLISTISRTPIDVTTDHILLQDGFGPIELVVDLAREELVDNSIHQAIFRLRTPSPSLATPTGFVRPRISDVYLFAITGQEERRTLLATGVIDESGSFSFQSDEINIAMQNAVRGIGDLIRFEFEVPVKDASLDIAFFGKEPGVDGPRLIFTVTEVN